MARPKTESSKTRAAFDAYLALGPSRSLEKLHRSFPDRSPSLRWLKAWSAAFDWASRAAAYDAEQLARQRAEREAADAEERERLRGLRYRAHELRVQALISEYDDLQEIKTQRATAEKELAQSDPSRAIAGTTTGQMVRKWKAVGFRAVEEAAIDDGRIARGQSLLKQIAQELGQWTEKSEVRGVLLIKDPKDMSDAELDAYLAGESPPDSATDPPVSSGAG